MKPPKIVICIEGGLFQWSASTFPVDLAVIDLDTEGHGRE